MRTGLNNSKVDDANSSMGLKLSYRSDCLDGKNLMDTNVCDGVKVGDEVDFEVKTNRNFTNFKISGYS